MFDNNNICIAKSRENNWLTIELCNWNGISAKPLAQHVSVR